jgi:TBC1 domain family member 20
VLKVLDSFFAKNANLKYIQGFHDVASIFLVIFGSSPGYYMMEKAGKTYFKDYLTQDLGVVGTKISQLIMELLVKKDKTFIQTFECF